MRSLATGLREACGQAQLPRGQGEVTGRGTGRSGCRVAGHCEHLCCLPLILTPTLPYQAP